MSRVPLTLEYDLLTDAVFIKYTPEVEVKIDSPTQLWDVLRRQGLLSTRTQGKGPLEPALHRESLREFLDRGGEVKVSTKTQRKRAKAMTLDDLFGGEDDAE